MKVLKKLGWLAIPVLLVAAAALFWVVKPILLSSYLTSRLDINVFIGSIDLGKKETRIGHFRIGNPYGYRFPSALTAARMSIEYRLQSLFGRPSEIDLIALKDIVLNVEFDNPTGTKNNWTRILDRMPKHVRMQKEFLIHRLTLDNITVQIKGLGFRGEMQIQKVDHVELNEIDSKDGFPTKELIAQIFGGVGIQQYLENLINPPNIIKKVFTPFGE